MPDKLMTANEDPADFETSIRIGDVEITYSNLMEISQGGPVVGDLSVNGEKLKGRYGGPLLYKDHCIYVPVQVRKFLGTGFKLAKVDVVDNVSQLTGKFEYLIFLDKIADGCIYFFKDIGRASFGKYESV